jgi:hypothetical protein
MGAWGHGIFDNDDAADWVYELEEAADDGVVERTLRAVASQPEDAYVEAPEAAAALAAAEVVAASVTGSHDALVSGGAYSEGALAWVRSHGSAVRPELVPLALAALRRARHSSELRELWDEAGPDEWLAEVGGLERRLQSAT